MKITRLFSSAGGDALRIPSIVSAPDGKVYAFANKRINTDRDDADETRLMVAVKNPGEDWGEPFVGAAHPGWSYMIGSAVCDENTGSVMCFFKKIAVMQNEFVKTMTEEARRALASEKEKADGIAEGDYILETFGEGFTERKIEISPSPFCKEGFLNGRGGFTHGGGSGITLHAGPYAGRLLIPARMSLHPTRTWEDLKTGSTNTLLYSDDHGETFHTGGIVEPGTGEGALAERSDGSIYFNSRAYFGDGLRRGAISLDGGLTFEEQHAHRDLIEPCCNADLLRVDYNGKICFLFSNPHSTTERTDMTLSLSEDEGKSWRFLLTLDHRKASYSSLCYEPREKKIYLLFECGEKTCIDEIDVAEFSLKEVLG